MDGYGEKLFKTMFSGKMTEEELAYVRLHLNRYYCAITFGAPHIVGRIDVVNPSHHDDGTKNHIYLGLLGRYYPVSLETFEPESPIPHCDKQWVSEGCWRLKKYAAATRSNAFPVGGR